MLGPNAVHGQTCNPEAEQGKVVWLRGRELAQHVSKPGSILGMVGDELLGTDIILEDREITSPPSMVL